MNKSNKTNFAMTNEELKSLKKSIEDVKKLDIFKKKKEKNDKVKKAA